MMVVRICIPFSYYHHQIGSMMPLPLFSVRSWNNGMRCMYFYILIDSDVTRAPWRTQSPQTLRLVKLENSAMESAGALRWRHNELDGVSDHQPYHCLLKRLIRRRSKKTPKLRITGLCVGNSPVPGELLAQMASNAENVSIWWRHHGPIDYFRSGPVIQKMSPWHDVIM